MKLLLPYEDMSNHLPYMSVIKQFVRYSLHNKFIDYFYVFCAKSINAISGSEKWKIGGGFSQEIFFTVDKLEFDTVEEAMSSLDSILKDNGYTLLDEDKANKYKLLM